MKGLFIPAALLAGTGLIVISSVSPRLFHLQLVWVVIGTLISVFSRRRNILLSILRERWVAWLLYGASVVFLIAAYFLGPSVRNTRAWLVMGPISFQPVELIKVSLILLYAGYFSRRHLTVARTRYILTSFLYTAAPAVIVVAQPNLGGAALLFALWLGFLAAAGLPWRRIVIVLFIAAALGVLGWQSVLQEYHRARVLGFLYPERDVLGINYSAIQSKIAIGSAGWWGKGYGQGSQVQLGFLTVPSSDFVFAALVEEWGLFAGLAVIFVFAWLLYIVLRVGMSADQNFEKFVCLGAAIVFSTEFFLNMGSNLGLIPVVGITLPFISYGGSNFIANSFLLAIVNTIGRRS